VKTVNTDEIAMELRNVGHFQAVQLDRRKGKIFSLFGGPREALSEARRASENPG